MEPTPRVAKSACAAERGRQSPFSALNAPVPQGGTKSGLRLDPASARRMSKVIATAQSRSAKIIGVTGPRSGIGVSVMSRQLAGALASFGVRTMLVDLSTVTVDTAERHAPEASLLSFAVEKAPSLSFVDIPAGADRKLSAQGVRASLSQAVQDGYTVVVDLPPVMHPSGQPTPSTVAVGPLCDIVFLVSLSGQVSRAELSGCVEASKIIGLKLGGMILNDWRMPASSLIGS